MLRVSVAITALAWTLVLAWMSAGEPAAGQLPVGGTVPTYLSLAIDSPGGWSRGHGRGRVVRIPVRVTSSVGQAQLRVSGGPPGAPLKQWRDPVAQARATVEISRRRALRSTSAPGASQTVLISISGETP